MKKDICNSQHYEISNEFKFFEYLSKATSTQFSVLRVTLSGIHSKVKNIVSERIYYVLDGQGEIAVGEENYQVKAGDLVFVKPNEIHGLTGNMEYLVITSPPYTPENEITIE